jgi:hypothetical protein
MPDRWNIEVARVDTIGNLYLDGNINSQSGDSYVIVDVGDSPTSNASNLRDAYADAIIKTPNDNAISKTNRVAVLIPPGQYDMGSTPLVLSAEFVDLIATIPTSGRPTENLDEANGDWVQFESENYFPPCTILFSTEPTYVVEQAASDIRMVGFGIATLHAGSVTGGSKNASAFYTSATDNSDSYYDTMYFFGNTTDIAGGFKYPTRHFSNVYGTWRNCIANGFAWRYAGGVAADEWGPTMYDCKAGVFSYIGDTIGAEDTVNCHLERCFGGDGCFAGCTIFTGWISSDATFIDCTGGHKCFGQTAEIAGTFIRCRAGDYSFGGSFISTIDGIPQAPGRFTGYAEDCFAGKASFGGVDNPIDGYIGGEIVRCTTTGNVLPLKAQGATIRDSKITSTTTNIDALNIADDNTVITGSEILVNDAGTGVPVNAGSAQNVVAVNCTFNNGDNDSDGLGANITNLALTASNGVY